MDIGIYITEYFFLPLLSKYDFVLFGGHPQQCSGFTLGSGIIPRMAGNPITGDKS